MGLFDALFGNLQPAADAQISSIQQGMAQATPQLQAGIGAINTGYGNALNQLPTNYLTGLALGQGGYGNALQSLANTGIAGLGAIGNYYGAGGQALGTGLYGGQQALNTAFGQGAQALGYGLGGATGAVNQGVGQAVDTGLGGGQSAIQGIFGPAQQRAMALYGAGTSPFADIFNQGTQGTTAYANAAGLNGPAGNAAAIQGFMNNPGYQFQLQQGINAANAGAAAGGTLGSGGNQMDLARYAEGLANQSWGNYMQQLSPFLQQQQAGAGGIQAGSNAAAGTLANMAQGQAGLTTPLYSNAAQAQLTGGLTNAQAYQNWASGLSNLLAQQGTQGAGMYGQYGANLANLLQAQGGATNAAYQTLGQNLANAQIGAGTLGNTDYTQMANALSALYTGQANALNPAYTNYANMLYGGNVSQGTAQANADIANMQMSANMLGGILGLGSAALGAPKGTISGPMNSLWGGIQSAMAPMPSRWPTG